ncbi:ATP-binding cassette glutathione S-conjugate transporter ycf1 [Coemansia sp. RSA 2337]|nr:ATP-binding cassette glutathione S-conjugate transporter ycf1 [Coemansia sp. RSA 2337]
MVSNKLSAVATITRVIKTSPGLLVMCGPLVALNYAIECWHRGTLPKLYDVHREAISRHQERLDDVLKCNRPLLRIHDMTDTYLDKLCQLKAMELSYESSNVIDDYVIDQLSQYISYTKDTPREQPHIVADSRPLPCWPETGEIEFRQYRLRYRPDLDLALNDLSFVVHNKEKIGIVGHTGTGKSLLTYALMRLVEADSGSIIIDGVDISTIGLHDLCSCISIIPQDPSLFEGTIRDNLDPTHKYTDDEVWAAIDACQIADLLDMPAKARKPKIMNPGKASKEEPKQPSKVHKRHWLVGTRLDKWVKYKGSNFSVRQ